MNGEVFKAWVEKVFIPAVRARSSERVVLVVDKLSSHETVEHDHVEFITLPPNTTAIFQPLDAGVIETLKWRYKRRFLRRLVEHLERSDGAHQGTRASSSLLTIERANLMDVATIIREEWAAMTQEHIVRCWIKADCLPAGASAQLRARHADYPQPDTPAMAADVQSMTGALMRSSLHATLFPSAQSTEVAAGVAGWLNAERHVHAIEDTSDLDVSGQDDDA